jgi:hypothetical protein
MYYLCEHNAVAGNPVDGVKRPMANGNEGSTPALGDAQARRLLEAPPGDTLKGVRDRAILATLQGVVQFETGRRPIDEGQSVREIANTFNVHTATIYPLSNMAA